LSLVWLAYQPRKPGCVLLADFDAAIDSGTVSDDVFKVRLTLGQYRADGFFDNGTWLYEEETTGARRSIASAMPCLFNQSLYTLASASILGLLLKKSNRSQLLNRERRG
jgi:hypothetical protein